MLKSAQDPHLANRHSDELIPAWMEETPLTWLDEIGLHRELDAAVSRVMAALEETGESHPEDHVRRAIAAWIEKAVRLKPDLARLLTTDGAEEILSILELSKGDDSNHGSSSTLTIPPPPLVDGRHAGGGGGAAGGQGEQAF